MADGLTQLRRGLAAFEDTLESFSGPLVERHAGLRLMAESLRERRDHIEDQIRKLEVAALEVRFSGPAVPAALLAGVLAALQEALHATGEALGADAPEVDPALRTAALTLHLDAGGMAPGVIRLRRHAGSRAGLLVVPGADEPLVERALLRLVEELAGGEAEAGGTAGTGGRGGPRGAAGAALRALGQALLGSGLVVTVAVTAPLGRAEARLDQRRAQQLADARGDQRS